MRGDPARIYLLATLLCQRIEALAQLAPPLGAVAAAFDVDHDLGQGLPPSSPIRHISPNP